MNIPLMSIRIGIDPDMVTIGNFVLTWHGFLTFISVAIAVFLVGRWAKKEGLVTDAVYSVAVWAIIGGIVGARALHILDLWGEVYSDNPGQIVKIWEGGITIYGAILGGFITAAGYMIVRNSSLFLRLWSNILRGVKLERSPLPSVGRLADITAPAILIAMAVGRIGDIINGEHVAKLTELPWGFVYTHVESPSHQQYGFASSHPAVVYEMLLDIIILVAIWLLRDRLRPHGMLFALYLASYSLGKFFISFLRSGPLPLNEELVIGLNEAQLVALAVLIITVPLLLFKAQLVKPSRVTRPPVTKARSRG